ncbi:unnamed protein product [Oikopleura dioica]|uniref:Uncharacterized protein n=1 Tax=Oikopleura dioica TaxID=34765 RepID=E4YX92_OIKDI|nr:unnamed protein product [Oikopleura dioica]
MGLFSPPTVEAVRARRWTVFIVSILENMLFAAPLFGAAQQSVISLNGHIFDP